MAFGLVIVTSQGRYKRSYRVCLNTRRLIQIATRNHDASLFRHFLFDVIPSAWTTFKKPPAGFERLIGPGCYISAYNCRIFENRIRWIDNKGRFFLLSLLILDTHAPVHPSQLNVCRTGIDLLSQQQFSSCCFGVTPAPVAQKERSNNMNRGQRGIQFLCDCYLLPCTLNPFRIFLIEPIAPGVRVGEPRAGIGIVGIKFDRSPEEINRSVQRHSASGIEAPVSKVVRRLSVVLVCFRTGCPSTGGTPISESEPELFRDLL